MNKVYKTSPIEKGWKTWHYSAKKKQPGDNQGKSISDLKLIKDYCGEGGNEYLFFLSIGGKDKNNRLKLKQGRLGQAAGKWFQQQGQGSTGTACPERLWSLSLEGRAWLSPRNNPCVMLKYGNGLDGHWSSFPYQDWPRLLLQELIFSDLFMSYPTEKYLCKSCPTSSSRNSALAVHKHQHKIEAVCQSTGRVLPMDCLVKYMLPCRKTYRFRCCTK